MKLTWTEYVLIGGRVDLDLRNVYGDRLGYFIDYLRQPLKFEGPMGFGDLTFPNQTIEEAKKVVEAMIMLEG